MPSLWKRGEGSGTFRQTPTQNYSEWAASLCAALNHLSRLAIVHHGSITGKSIHVGGTVWLSEGKGGLVQFCFSCLMISAAQGVDSSVQRQKQYLTPNVRCFAETNKRRMGTTAVTLRWPPARKLRGKEKKLDGLELTRWAGSCPRRTWHAERHRRLPRTGWTL